MRVISIPHSGTRTLLALFGLGFNGKTHAHIKPEGNAFDARVMIGRWPCCVVTLRNPADVWESWAQEGWTNADEFLFSWSLLGDLVECYDLEVLPVDHPRRDDCLDRVRRRWPHLVIPSVWTWPRHGARNRKRRQKPVPPIDLESALAVCARLGYTYKSQGDKQEACQPMNRDTR